VAHPARPLCPAYHLPEHRLLQRVQQHHVRGLLQVHARSEEDAVDEQQWPVPGPASHLLRTGTYRPVGISDFFRISRYDVGGRFAWHTDSTYAADREHVGVHTLLLYLNDDFEGGHTDVRAQEDGSEVVRSVTPRTGRVVVFHHMLVHAGLPVIRGSKIVLRTEVLFSRM
jgi:2OG-Fe(II) oxygenase superfamily